MGEPLETIVVKLRRTFADVVRLLKSQIDPVEEGAKIERVTKTRDGDVILKMRESAKGAIALLTENLKNKVSEIGE